MKRFKATDWKEAGLPLAAFGATGLLLSVIQPPYEMGAMAWIAFVPFLAVCRPEAGGRRLFVIAYVACLLYWLGNMHWLVPVTVVGWLVFGIYTAVLWPVMALAVRWCRRKRIPLVIAAPVLIVGIERMQGFGLGGFAWRLLGHSQFRNIELIQIADIFGAGGVSFVVGMVNGAIADIILMLIDRTQEDRPAAPRSRYIRLGIEAAATAAIVVAALLYGRWRIDQTDLSVETGPAVAAVQSNIPQSLKRSFESSDELFAALMQQSSQAAEAGADLIVWPETMVQAPLNANVTRLPLDPCEPAKVYDTALKAHAKGSDAHLLVGAYGVTPQVNDDMSVTFTARFNSAFLYNPDGTQAAQTYSKIHLVPFGEVLPLRRKLSWFYELLMKVKFIPYSFDYSLDYGREYTVFEMHEPQDGDSEEAQSGRRYHFSVMICYEDVVPYIAREFALDDEGRKQVDWLVNISNDGWFVQFDDDANEVRPSAELQQHAALCVFRAVENRLAIVRSVNTGISCVIDSVGRLRDDFVAGTLPEHAMGRTGMAGWLLDTVPVDSRITFFTKYGPLLDFGCQACVIAFIIAGLSVRIIEKRKKVHLSGKSHEQHPPPKQNKRTQPSA